MAYIIPFGAIEIATTDLEASTLTAITSILVKRGEKRNIQKLWWNAAIQSYYILIKTAEHEPVTTHSISSQSVNAIIRWN